MQGSASVNPATASNSSPCLPYSSWPFRVRGSKIGFHSARHPDSARGQHWGAWWCWRASRRRRPSGSSSTTTTRSRSSFTDWSLRCGTSGPCGSTKHTVNARRMTWQGSPKSRPSLPWRRPWWLAVLLAMLAFGLVQEQAKIKVNHYMQVADDEHLWDEDAETRQAWWEKRPRLTATTFTSVETPGRCSMDLPVPNWSGQVGVVGGDPSCVFGP